MSLTGVYNIRIEPYIPQASLDSPWPIGEWRGCLNFAGDASGGYVGAVFAPVSAAEARKFLWSWEGCSVTLGTQLLAQIVCLLDLTTAEALEPLGLSVEFYRAIGYIPPNAVTVNTAMSMEKMPDSLRKIHRPRAGLTNSFSIYIDGNLGAGVTHYFDSWGYIWHPQARTLAGGPRRP